jgi:hypothetical protein
VGVCADTAPLLKALRGTCEPGRKFDLAERIRVYWREFFRPNILIILNIATKVVDLVQGQFHNEREGTKL